LLYVSQSDLGHYHSLRFHNHNRTRNLHRYLVLRLTLCISLRLTLCISIHATSQSRRYARSHGRRHHLRHQCRHEER
ncbi:hypothetical protein K474DRAFT_1700709, partial [Panus rudis PR-1116 ss-1]